MFLPTLPPILFSSSQSFPGPFLSTLVQTETLVRVDASVEGAVESKCLPLHLLRAGLHHVDEGVSKRLLIR